MSRKISAKDAAFEKERAKYRQEIRRLEDNLKKQVQKNCQLKDAIRDQEAIIMEKDDWIRRLLEYMDMSEEDMRNIIAKEKRISDLAGTMGGVLLKNFFMM